MLVARATRVAAPAVPVARRLAMLDKKLGNVRTTGAGTVVACDMSCLMHMQGGLARDGAATRCAHLAEVLAEALTDERHA